MSDYTTLIDGATDDETSSSVQWSAGHCCVFVTGTFGHNNTRVVIEGSADNTNFAPIEGLDDISDPMVKYFQVTGHAFIRAKVTDAHDAPNAPNLTVQVM